MSIKFTTNDLSKILGVSTNTIRRFDEKGYLSGVRNEENGYREFDYGDVERLMYIAKYRKEDMSHEEVDCLIESDVDQIISSMEAKREEIRKKMAYYKAVEHMLKDDVMLLKRAGDMQGQMLDMDCQPFHYVTYQKNGEMLTSGEHGKALHRFMEECPDFLYMYLFEKNDIENNSFVFSEGVGANQLMTGKYKVTIDPQVESFPLQPCVLRFIKAPLNIVKAYEENPEHIWQLFFGDVFDYMKNKNYLLNGDVIVLKIGFAKDRDGECQYLLLHYPITGSKSF